MSYDIVIIGGGPAGLTSGLYSTRSGLKSILVERGAFGGQILNTRLIENYPGFPDGISGAELGEFMYRQAIKYNLETQVADTLQLDKQKNYKVYTSEGDIQAKAVIIAAGSKYRKLNITGEKRLSGYGVSYCATCDGFFFRDRTVAVVGGGDTAITDALELAQHAKRIYIIHRRGQLRAGRVLQQQAFKNSKLEFIWDTIAKEVIGESKVEELALLNVKTGQKSKLKIDGVFVAVGLIPNSQAFLNILELDKDGYIITDEHMATSAPGVFAAGDIRRHSPRQIAAAVGDGVAAAMSAFRYIQQQNN